MNSDDKPFKIDFKKDRYKYFGTYKVDKWITTGCMFLLFAYYIFVAQAYNFSLDYYSCAAPPYEQKLDKMISAEEKEILTGPTPCKNPFYKAITWKNYEYLPYGNYGTKPGFLFKSVLWVTLLVFTLGLYLNHIIYNKKKGVRITPGGFIKLK